MNVTTVIGDTKREQKAALHAALVEWINEGDHFIKQELQATIIRVDAKMKQTMDQWFIQYMRKSKPIFHRCLHQLIVGIR
ncbi:hypothetical protein [Bacillus sp. JCM 19034]|uniref:hypothetical protein n=1 Tax=Bacillus sp. JCM 19034 TaxID=1481928 RepID=UPI000785D9CE|nr:hypothetical protein [Bacillus sp. JCM 19034]